jgi:hypothetical protein
MVIINSMHQINHFFPNKNLVIIIYSTNKSFVNSKMNRGDHLDNTNQSTV